MHAYRVHCATNSNPGQLILPESLKLLPLLINSLIKREIFRQASNIKPDERMRDYIRLNTLTPLAINNWLYPKIYPIHNIYENKDSIIIGAEID